MVELVKLQMALAGRYSLEREIGRGGMGVVYLAREVALDRPVAIKFLNDARAADLRLALGDGKDIAGAVLGNAQSTVSIRTR